MDMQERIAAEAKRLAVKAAEEAKDIAQNDLLGHNEWQKSKIGYLTGASAIVKAVSTVGGVIGGAGRNIRTMYHATFRRDTAATPLPTTSDDPAERFRVAQRVYGKTDAEVRSFQASTHRGFLLYAFLLVAAVAFGIFSMNLYDTGLSQPFDLMSRFVPVPALLALTVRWAFYNWQFRTRRLGSVAEWLRQPGEWWPMPPDDRGSAGGTGGQRKGRAASAALLLAVLIGAVAWADPALAAGACDDAAAASGNVLDKIFKLPCDRDIWRGMLEQVFPQLGPLGGDHLIKHGAIAEAFGVFLAVLMSVASMFMSWHVILGMVHTAHEGKVLGQRWHQIWAPIRVSMGVGALAPVVKGYCVAQILVLQIAVWGGSFGNAIWAAYIKGLSDATVQVHPKANDTTTFFENLMVVEMCHAVLTAHHTNLADGTPSPVPAWPTEPRKTTLRGTNPKVFDVTIESMNITRTGQRAELNTRRAERENRTWDYGVCGNVTGDFFTKYPVDYVVQLDKDRADALSAARTQMRTLAQRFGESLIPGKSVTPPTAAELAQVKTTYDQALVTANTAFSRSDAGRTVSEDIQKFKTNATAAGWASAGSFYVTLSRMNAQKLEDIKNTITVVPGDLSTTLKDETLVKLFMDERTGAMPKIAKIVEDMARAPSPNAANPDLNSHDNMKAMRAGANPNGIEYMVMQIFGSDTYVSEWLVGLMQINPEPDKSSLQKMITWGHRILEIFWGIMLAIVVIKGVSAASKIAGGIGAKIVGGVMSLFTGKNADAESGGLLSSLWWFIIMTLIGLLVTGVLHAYILPMMPFMQFFFFTMGMLILVVEGIIAAPLWAFFHVRMDGQEFVDQVQRPGYMIIFNMFLRIPLAMFGLMFSLLVFDATIWLLGKTFYPAVVAGTSQNVFGLIGILVYMVMLSYLHWQIAVRSFAMITQVPDRVSRWFGAQPDGHDGHQEAEKSSNFVVGQVQQSMGNFNKRGMGAGAMGMLGGRTRQNTTDTGSTLTAGDDPAQDANGSAAGNAAGSAASKISEAALDRVGETPHVGESAGGVVQAAGAQGGRVAGEQAGQAAGSTAGGAVAGPPGAAVGGELGRRAGGKLGENAGRTAASKLNNKSEDI